ncbi:unnamed protein product [Clonostachys rosea]|uniref:Calcium-transporting ATPase n=1 Tax=Bionectria ochroleuca TaxID=29856 RepID=A0ABY6UQ01_BIOOC|nr:unnamed protein product [Clonostachys rosea]
MRTEILDTGISVVYEPSDRLPIVDIVIVHGLHGHPYKSWLRKPSNTIKSPQTSPEVQSGLRKLSWKSTKSTPADDDGKPVIKDTAGSLDDDPEPIFWPQDLLPDECPDARILVFGYDSKITKCLSGPTNKGSLFAHGRDLLFSLSRERLVGRPLVFVAHSLGGIVVKEALARSSISPDVTLKDVAKSTAAVMFLGTPHRGSPDLAALGEYVRSIASTLWMDTTPALLDALGLKTTDLERAQESFSAIWQKYNFQVKTFQEGLPMTKLGLGTTKIVPDTSSSLGDHRERAETLQANHKELCRFSGDRDPNYQKVAGEFRSIYSSIQKLQATTAHEELRKQLRQSLLMEPPSIQRMQLPGDDHLSDEEARALQWLWSPGIHARYHGIGRPAGKTCSWLFDHRLYQDWLNRRDGDHCGLLWVKGKPGTGKSVLMKEAFHRINHDNVYSDSLMAGFFFSAKGTEPERSAAGFWKSLLYQLLLRDRESLSKLCSVMREKGVAWDHEGLLHTNAWGEEDFQSFFHLAFLRPGSRSLFIFIDALDELHVDNVRQQAYFWRDATMIARENGVSLSVCISSRHFPSVTLSNCPEIVIEDHSQKDIAAFVKQKFELGIAADEDQWAILRDRILEKSAGIFLWAVLVVEEVLRKWDEGKNIRSLLKEVDVLPHALQELFRQMLSSVEPDTRQLTLRLFQWGVLAKRPLRIYEWYHILAVIQQPSPLSLAEWRASDHCVENSDQLERWVRSMSKGLLEVKRDRPDEAQDRTSDTSVLARAGSLSLEAGDTRVVQVIHESVREFFLLGQGFNALDHRPNLNLIGDGHLSIIHSCLDYLNIMELDAFIQARARAKDDLVIIPGRKPGRHRPRPGNLSPKPRNLGTGCPAQGGLTNESSNEKPLSEALVTSNESGGVSDVTRWLEVSQAALEDASPSASVYHSAISSSLSGKSQMLEDFPALLPYAILELFSHAIEAQSGNMDPRAVITRLSDENTWSRVVALREDFPNGFCLHDCAANFSLHSWIPFLEDKQDGCLIVPVSPRSGHGASSEKGLKPSRKLTTDQSSVWSFASAGTHRESSFYTHRADSYDSGVEKPTLDPNVVLRPDPGLEDDFRVDNNPFAFSPGQLNMLMNPRSINVLSALGGLDELVYGLRSDITAGLSADETTVLGAVSFEEAITAKAGQRCPASRVYDSSAGRFEDRVRVFKRNILPQRKIAPWWRFTHTANRRSWAMLFVVAILALVLGVYGRLADEHLSMRASSVRWAEMTVVCIAIVLNLAIDFLCGWYADGVFSNLQKRINASSVRVVRSGRTVTIATTDVVVGDILLLQPGDIVPVDGICVESFSLKCDESCTTGESDLMPKCSGQMAMEALKSGQYRRQDPFILSQSKIVEGHGKLICTSVGIYSCLGKTLMALVDLEFQSPFELHLQKLTTRVTKFGSAVALILFTALFIRFLIILPRDSGSSLDKASSFVGILLICLVISSASAPRNLIFKFPLAFTYSKMWNDGILVKPQRSCEAVANITTICLDMAGALTRSETAVVAGRFGPTEFCNVNLATGSSPWKPKTNPVVREVLIEAICTNSMAYKGDQYGGTTFVGSSTDVALLEFAEAYLGLPDQKDVESNVEIVQRVAFIPSLQCSGMVVKRTSGHRLYITGAADIVLGWCDTEINDELEQITLVEPRREAYTETISQYSTQSRTAVGIAYMDFAQWPISDTENISSIRGYICSLHGLTLVGVVAISNSLRDCIKNAVMDARKAGISVRLATGESLVTARAIASESGILTNGAVLEGPIFRQLSGEEMFLFIPKMQILARASAEDKKILVRSLKDQGETVALCDYSAEAVAALRSADVGFSKGISGTDMAKNASSIILTNEGLDTIVKAIKWSRSLIDGVRRCIQFQLSGTISMVLAVAITAVADKDMKPAISASQLFWICLILNPFAAFALATRTSTSKVLDRKPECKRNMITSNMWKMIVGQSIYQVTVTLVLYFAGPLILGDGTSPAGKTRLSTVIFNTFFWMQIFNALNSRRLDDNFNIFEDIHRDTFFLGIICLVAGIQVVIILFGSAAFQVLPGGLDTIDWVISVVSASVSLIWGILVRLFPNLWISIIMKPFTQLFQKLGSFGCFSRSPQNEDEYPRY